uniref:Putative secreted protein n=1 Tax=Panstrongylus lignarius TaxID=156445 RepID=A0A224XR62_9HEMI
MTLIFTFLSRRFYILSGILYSVSGSIYSFEVFLDLNVKCKRKFFGTSWECPMKSFSSLQGDISNTFYRLSFTILIKSIAEDWQFRLKYSVLCRDQ